MKGGIGYGDKQKNLGFIDLFKKPKISWPFKKKKDEPQSDDDLYPLEKAKDYWKKAAAYYRTGSYDKATIHFRRFVEMLFKANCSGFVSSSESNLLVLANKAFDEIPTEIHSALVFLNPHCTLVKSVYSPAFVDEIYEKSKLIAEWVFSQTSKYTHFNLNIE